MPATEIEKIVHFRRNGNDFISTPDSPDYRIRNGSHSDKTIT